jgi:hypothetical protein
MIEWRSVIAELVAADRRRVNRGRSLIFAKAAAAFRKLLARARRLFSGG